MQQHCQQIICELVTYYHRKYPDYNKLCIAGGVGLNCLINSAVAELNLFESVYVQPASNDAGTSLGASAYVMSDHQQVRPQRIMSPYLGPEFSEDDIQKCLDSRADIYHEKCENVYKHAADKLANGQIIGWFQGRMEFGPRALGNRSILSSPCDVESRSRINAAIKRRELFRPLAPAVMDRYASDYFEIFNNARDMYPYMLSVVKTKGEKKELIPATVHIDNSARIQIVSPDTNKAFHNLLQEFFDITGVPVLLNTSFNIGNEPIVCTPDDAVNSFVNSNLDCCYIGNFYICRGEK